MDAATADEVREALIWMTGSDDFSPGGKAHEGFERIVRPVLDKLFGRVGDSPTVSERWADLPRCPYCNEKGTHAPQCDRPTVSPDFCVQCEGQHDEGKHSRSPTVSEPRTPTAVALVARYRSSNPDDWPEPGELVRAIPTIEAEAAQPIDVPTLAALAYADRPPTGARPVPWPPRLRKDWEAWARRIAARLRASDTDHD